jgi:hypothetical protein
MGINLALGRLGADGSADRERGPGYKQDRTNFHDFLPSF